MKLIKLLKETWNLNKERYKVTLSDGQEIDVVINEGGGVEEVKSLIEENKGDEMLKARVKIVKIEKKAARPTLS